MAYSFEVDANGPVLLIRFTGSVSEQRIEQFYREAGALIDRLQPRAAICDLTEVTSFDVSSGSVQSMASAPPLIPAASCPRVVVAPAGHIFAMSRMFQIRGEHSRPSLAVVQSMEEALRMIGLEQPDFKPIQVE